MQIQWRYNAGNFQFLANGVIDHKDEVLYFGDTSVSLVQTNRPTPKIRVASTSASFQTLFAILVPSTIFVHSFLSYVDVDISIEYCDRIQK